GQAPIDPRHQGARVHGARQFVFDAHWRRAATAEDGRSLSPYRRDPRRIMIRVGEAAQAPSFRDAARRSLSNTQLRENVRRATDTIRGKRAAVVGEMSDWQELRDAAQRIKQHT